MGRTYNPQAFRKGQSYEYGELTSKSSIDRPEWRTKSIIRSGEWFLSKGCRTVQQYLDQNPEGLRADRALTFYNRLPNGERVYMHAGNPSPQQTTSPLEDAMVSPQTNPAIPAHMLPAATPGDTPGNYDEAVATTLTTDLALSAIRDTLDVVKQTNKDLMEQLAHLRGELSRLHSEYGAQIAELQTQILIAKREAEEYKRNAAEVEKEFTIREEYQKTVNGLQDKIKADSGTSMQDILSALPAIVNLVTAFQQSQAPRPAAPAQAYPMPPYSPAPSPMSQAPAAPQPMNFPQPQIIEAQK